MGLIVDGKLKRAAVLLFYRNPQRLFTRCYIKIGRFGVGSDLQYQDVVEGSLILIADRVVDLIYLKYLNVCRNLGRTNAAPQKQNGKPCSPAWYTVQTAGVNYTLLPVKVLTAHKTITAVQSTRAIQEAVRLTLSAKKC